MKATQIFVHERKTMDSIDYKYCILAQSQKVAIIFLKFVSILMNLSSFFVFALDQCLI